MSVSDCIRHLVSQALPGTIGEISARTELPLPTIRFHIYANSGRDALTGEWVDVYAWRWKRAPEGWLTREFYSSGKERL